MEKNIYDSYGLDDFQFDLAKELYEENKSVVCSYSLEEVDREIAECWLEDTDDEDYKKFLSIALNNCAEIYTLTDHLGDFTQPIGEFVVY